MRKICSCLFMITLFIVMATVYSITAAVDVVATEIAAPKSITYKVSADNVILSWDKVDGADGYRIYQYNADKKKFVEIKSVKTNKAVIANIDKGRKYWFKVGTLTKNKKTYKVNGISEKIEINLGADNTTKKKTVDTKNSVEMENAVKTAQSYLSFSSFSRKRLIDQLVYEGYPRYISEKAVDTLNIDWNEQVVKKAEGYLKVKPYSKKGLKEQLEYEGFTEKQAIYATNKVMGEIGKQDARSNKEIRKLLPYAKYYGFGSRGGWGGVKTVVKHGEKGEIDYKDYIENYIKAVEEKGFTVEYAGLKTTKSDIYYSYDVFYDMKCVAEIRVFVDKGYGSDYCSAVISLDVVPVDEN